MTFKVIDVETLDTRTLREKYPIPPQHGPLRQYDREMRCASRGCGSSTFYRVNGIARCMTHALHELNDLLAEGIDGNSDQESN